MTLRDAVLKFSKWKEGRASLKVIFLWEGVEVHAAAISAVDDDSLSLLLDTGKQVSLPLGDALFRTGDPSEAAREIRAESIAGYVCCIEVSLPHDAKLLLFEMKQQ